MTPQELNEMEAHAESGMLSDHSSIKQMSQYILMLIPEVRRLRAVEGKTRQFAHIVPCCDCGAYENKTKPCSANCRIDRDFRTVLFGEYTENP